MKSRPKQYDFNALLTTAAKRLGAQVQQDCQKRWVDLGGGKEPKCSILSYDFDDGVRLLLLDGTLPSDWEIRVESGKESPFMVLFSVRGGGSVSYGGLEAPIALQPLTTLLAAHPPGQWHSVSLTGGGSTTFAWLLLERSLYASHVACLPTAVRKEASTVFGNKTAVKLFPNTEYGMKSAALLQQVLDDGNLGLTHTTLAEAKCIELFSLQLRRWEEEIGGQAASTDVRLRPEDMEKIATARHLLVADLRNAPTIEALSKKSGVNRQKLKQGFKKMFGATINEYLRNERMRLARQLLAAGNASVREVSAAVGYHNPSYFARRFKEKFGLYPNEFLHSLTSDTGEGQGADGK